MSTPEMVIPQESLAAIAAAAEVGPVSSDVLTFLSASVEYHLRDIIDGAQLHKRRSMRTRLRVDDVNAALEMQNAEPVIGYSGGSGVDLQGADSGSDEKVDLQKVANESLPVCPMEPEYSMHWLAVQGKQPKILENEVPASSRVREKSGSKRQRGSNSGMDWGRGGGGGSDWGQTELSEELAAYLHR
ncbi:unnamed protein product, partial [Discosporangium mesarthrocarpum]